MNVADWAILGVVLVSTVVAASEGFFHQAFGIAGLIVGYLLAAWQYHRLAERFEPHLKSPWLGEIAAFVIIFIAVVIVAGIAGTRERLVVRVHHPDGNDGVRAHVEVAGWLRAGTLLPGDRKSSNLGGTFPVTRKILRRAGHGTAGGAGGRRL